MKNYGLLFVGVVASLVFFMALPAMSQEGHGQQSPPGATGTQPQISDEELEKAAAAYADVVEISEEFQQSIQGIEDESKRLELQESANERMISAIENAGLDVDTYNAILAEVRSNEKVRARFMEKTHSE